LIELVAELVVDTVHPLPVKARAVAHLQNQALLYLLAVAT
jgi:hypothetical protein